MLIAFGSLSVVWGVISRAFWAEMVRTREMGARIFEAFEEGEVGGLSLVRESFGLLPAVLPESEVDVKGGERYPEASGAGDSESVGGVGGPLLVLVLAVASPSENVWCERSFASTSAVRKSLILRTASFLIF